MRIRISISNSILNDQKKSKFGKIKGRYKNPLHLGEFHLQKTVMFSAWKCSLYYWSFRLKPLDYKCAFVSNKSRLDCDASSYRCLGPLAKKRAEKMLSKKNYFPDNETWNCNLGSCNCLSFINTFGFYMSRKSVMNGLIWLHSICTYLKIC